MYIQGVIQENRLDLNLDGRYWKEQNTHKKEHRKLYDYYNSLFGNLREKRNAWQRMRYWANPERARKVRRKYYKKHPASGRSIPEKYMPECGLNCTSCPHSDCILPENWMKRAQFLSFCQKNPEYFKQYRQQNKDRISAYNRAWYQKNKIEKQTKQKAHRSDPQVKKQRAEYDRHYRKEHIDADREEHRRYYQRHKEEINARKREKRAEKHR